MRTKADKMVIANWVFLATTVCLLALYAYLGYRVSAGVLVVLLVFQAHRVRGTLNFRKHSNRCDALIARIEELQAERDEQGNIVKFGQVDCLLDQLRAANEDLHKALK